MWRFKLKLFPRICVKRYNKLIPKLSLKSTKKRNWIQIVYTSDWFNFASQIKSNILKSEI